MTDNTARHGFEAAESAAALLRERTLLRPRIGLVLGSGLGEFADTLTEAVKVPFGQIPSFPRSSAIGHAGQLVIGKSGNVELAAMQGRVHLYEGHSPQEVAFPMRVFARMGIRAVVLTNAAGGINFEYGQGALVVIKDHINLQGHNPLIGPNDGRFGLRYPDMTQAYWKPYREIARDEATKLGMVLHEGIYAGMLGPSFETPAEVRFLRTIGADLVGMSTIAEVIVARHMGIKVLAISCVTNMAAGVLDQTITHEEVLETGARVRAQFAALLQAVLQRIAADVA